MADVKEGMFLFTVPVILNFEHIFKAHLYKGEAPDKARFEADLEIEGDNPNLAQMKATAAGIARAEWPGRDLNTNFKFPWTLGDVLADKAKAKSKDREHSRGRLVLKARSKFEPGLAAIVNGQLLDFRDERRPLAKPHFYNGVRVYAQVTFKAYNGIGQNPDGVNAFLDHLVSVGKGERLATGGTPTSEIFRAYIGTITAEDPTVGAAAASSLASI